jgi:hypothetical protein
MVIFPFLDDVKRPTDYRKGQQPTWKRWKIARPGKPTKNAWENHHAIDGFLSTISTGPFSIAMFVYQRVCMLVFTHPTVDIFTK